MNLKERIISDAGKLFFREGIKRVTMDDVAHELGISKRTIYENFKDKNHLLKAILQENIEIQKAWVAGIVSKAENALEIMVEILKYGNGIINKISPVYFSDLQRFFPEIWMSVYNENLEIQITNMKNILDRGKREDLFREEINTRLVAKVFSEQMAVLRDPDIFPLDQYPRNELFETVFLNFIRGIATRKGVDFLESLLEKRV